ncbi:hypothetical protein OUZ56_026496 [Daphnia magna]|uniref:Uncharacterized protein n=1 Tax=Daphnia magna TaxID=35525 RepID=A0ABQ9ZLX8_9CRUS|nr:hypothetical protein OUZ56_026496 [Daphnia magna]
MLCIARNLSLNQICGPRNRPKCPWAGKEAHRNLSPKEPHRISKRHNPIDQKDTRLAWGRALQNKKFAARQKIRHSMGIPSDYHNLITKIPHPAKSEPRAGTEADRLHFLLHMRFLLVVKSYKLLPLYAPFLSNSTPQHCPK